MFGRAWPGCGTSLIHGVPTFPNGTVRAPGSAKVVFEALLLPGLDLEEELLRPARMLEREV